VINVLVGMYHPQRFLDLLSFVEQLEKFGNIHFILYINSETFSKYTTIISSIKYHVVLADEIPIKPSKKKFKSNTYFKIKIISYIKRILADVLFVQLLREVRYLRFLKKKELFFARVMEDYDINVVLATGDRHVHEEPAILKAAQDSNAYILLPYLVNYADRERATHIRDGASSKNKSIYAYFMSKKFDRYLYNGLSFYPFYVLNALYKFGTLSSNPWVMGNGISDIVCLDSKNSYKRYLDYGVSQDKLRIVGDISYDNLYLHYSNKNKEILYSKYNLDASKKILIVALPQLAEHKIMSWTDHWKEIYFIVATIPKDKFNIILSLHPKMDILKYKHLEDSFECTIISERLVNILPAADMFIATYSSTVIWSTLCGIKTIVIDFYNLNWSLYEHLSSIVLIKNKELFLETINELLYCEIDFNSDWELLSKDQVFDGNVVKRYYRLINNLLS
jgi:hypothetical protein